MMSEKIRLMLTKRINAVLLSIGLSLSIITGCSSTDPASSSESIYDYDTEYIEPIEIESEENTAIDVQEQPKEDVISDESTLSSVFDLSEIPEYDGSSAYYILDKVPEFSQEEIDSDYFISLSELDSLGRCGTVTMKATYDMLPTEERGEIGSVKPSGWHTIKFNEDPHYEGLIEGNYLYNRCHLLMYALSGLNAEDRNLITGTRFLNIEGMLPFESKYLDYVSSGKDLLYRVTPVFVDSELVCRGVLLEAYSCYDDSIRDTVYCYNVQPGVVLCYEDGAAALADSAEAIAEANRNETSGDDAVPEDINPSDSKIQTNTEETITDNPTEETITDNPAVQKTYILNTNTKKIHIPSCSSVKQIKEKNKAEYTGNISDLESQGYDKCKNCNPL